MDLTSQVVLLGGTSTRRELIALRGRNAVDQALRHGILVRSGRGRYTLGSAVSDVHEAANVGGVLSHRSAALHWGWAQKSVPSRPEVTLPRHRRDEQPRSVLCHWADLPDTDIVGAYTTPERTLVDCMRNLPFDEALAIADSALRSHDFSYADLIGLAEATRGRGRSRIIGVARAASHLPANPFESVLRAQAILAGLDVRPQLPVELPKGRVVHPDVADQSLHIALEAEGFEWHSDAAAMTRDCTRYNLLTVIGWRVYRFTWQQVMFEPEYVQEILRLAVAEARGRSSYGGGQMSLTGRM